MEFKTTRDKIKGLLLLGGIEEIHNSKAQVPDTLPAGIVSLASRHGEVKVMSGYVKNIRIARFEVNV